MWGMNHRLKMSAIVVDCCVVIVLGVFVFLFLLSPRVFVGAKISVETTAFMYLDGRRAYACFFCQ
jgi:hypothetical protein